jgi:hypothetical protein
MPGACPANTHVYTKIFVKEINKISGNCPAMNGRCAIGFLAFRASGPRLHVTLSWAGLLAGRRLQHSVDRNEHSTDTTRETPPDCSLRKRRNAKTSHDSQREAREDPRRTRCRLAGQTTGLRVDQSRITVRFNLSFFPCIFV